MALKIENIKFSIFGKYDFMEATSENVSKLYGIFVKDKFLPNMIQMIQIEQPKNIMTKTMRPQFVNEETNQIITFLPDRIDIEIKENRDNSIDKIIEYYNEIKEKFQLGISRIALNTSAVIDVSTKEESQALRQGIVNDNSYPYGEDVIEWGSRNVARKKCEAIAELVNVGQVVESVGLVVESEIIVTQVKVNTDINTLAEIVDERFDVMGCKAFFEQAFIWNGEIFNNIERIS